MLASCKGHSMTGPTDSFLLSLQQLRARERDVQASVPPSPVGAVALHLFTLPLLGKVSAAADTPWYALLQAQGHRPDT